MSQKYTFFATCPKNLEGLLETELATFGATETKQTVAGVKFVGELEIAYRACLWSRLANRILLPLTNFPATSTNGLYSGIKKINWSEHLTPQSTFIVTFNGESEFIQNTHFGALKVKDAIADYMREKHGSRPNVDKINPDVWINVYLRNNEVTVYLDLSGESLHRRGYRGVAGVAPLKENLASAVVQRAGLKSQNYEILLDPMCGSGTLLIEAALILANIAPGLLRQKFGFSKWLHHDAALWAKLLQEARTKKRKKLTTKIYGYDSNAKVIAMAKRNAILASVQNYIEFSVKKINNCIAPALTDSGLIVTNPPYGERLGQTSELVFLYRDFGNILKEHFKNWTVAVLAGNPELCKEMRMRSHKEYQFFNGAIPCKLLLFKVNAKNN